MTAVTGLPAILKRLETMKTSSGKSVMRASLRAGLNVIGKHMKADLDPKAKKGKTAVKSRFKKGRRQLVAKVGFGVGKKRGQAVAKPAGRRGRGGVGIGPQNVHWWVAGTKKRVAGTRRGGGFKKGSSLQYRGQMPAMQPGLARIAYAKSAGKIRTEMVKRGALQLKKEITKAQKVK